MQHTLCWLAKACNLLLLLLLLLLQGLGNMVVFCGDGINDLAALRKADVGYAVGASDATVAASVSTSHKSVAGRHYHIPVTLC